MKHSDGYVQTRKEGRLWNRVGVYVSDGGRGGMEGADKKGMLECCKRKLSTVVFAPRRRGRRGRVGSLFFAIALGVFLS